MPWRCTPGGRAICEKRHCLFPRGGHGRAFDRGQPSAGVGPAAASRARLRSSRRARTCAGRQVLRHLPQPARENRGVDAGHAGSVGPGERRRDLGKSDPQGARRPDAAGRHAAPGEGGARRAGLVPRIVDRQGGSRASDARTPRASSAQPCGVRQRDPRPARARGRRHVAPAARRQRLRLRQHRRRPGRVAGADGAIPLGGVEDQQPGGRQSEDPAGQGNVPRPRRSVAGQPHRRAADRHARRHPPALPLPRRRRIRHQSEALSGNRQHHPRAGDAARSRNHVRRRADPAGSIRRRRGRKGELPQPDVGRRRAGEALSEAAGGEGRPARHGRRVREEKLGADGRAAAAVPARADRSDYAGRHSRAGQGHDRGAVQRHRIGRLAQPAADLHLHRDG